MAIIKAGRVFFLSAAAMTRPNRNRPFDFQSLPCCCHTVTNYQHISNRSSPLAANTWPPKEERLALPIVLLLGPKHSSIKSSNHSGKLAIKQSQDGSLHHFQTLLFSLSFV